MSEPRYEQLSGRLTDPLPTDLDVSDEVYFGRDFAGDAFWRVFRGYYHCLPANQSGQWNTHQYRHGDECVRCGEPKPASTLAQRERAVRAVERMLWSPDA